MAHITAAPAPVHVGDKEFMMSPLTDRDIEEVNNWLRGTFLRIVKESFDATWTPGDRDEALGAAIARARKMTFMSGEGMELMRSSEAVARLLWQGVKKNHPNVTWELLQTELLDPETELLSGERVQVAMKEWYELNVGKLLKKAENGKENGAPSEGTPKAQPISKSRPTRSTST